MEDETFLLDTHDGVPVVVHHWRPEGEVRAVLNLVHGMVEHAGRYAHVAQALNRVGVEVYAADLRGHGQTAQTEDELGHFADTRGWARVLDDLHRLTVNAIKQHPDTPVFILGHSMGSYLVQQYLYTFPSDVEGAVLSSTGGPIPLTVEGGAALARLERLRLGPRGRSPLLMKLLFGPYNKRFEPTRTGWDFLSRDAEQVDRYLADPKCGATATTQFFVDLTSGRRLCQELDRVRGIRSDLPIYIFAGSDDPEGGEAGVGKLLSLYEKAGLTAVEHRIYEGGRHEMFNEINRDEVIADLADWVERQLKVLEG